MKRLLITPPLHKLMALLLLVVLAQPAVAERIIPGVTAQLQAPDIKVMEGDYAVFRLALSRSFDFDLRYAYRTRDGTAKAGQDYEARQGHVVFSAGKHYAEISVKTHNDGIVDNEHFELVLSDMETHGHGMVWGQYVWTGWWRVEGLPDTKTVRAEIRNPPPVSGGWRQ